MTYSRIEGAWQDPTKQEIHLECPPGEPRPGDLIEEVIRGTGLPVRDSASRSFGHWEWDYTDIPRELWEEATPAIERRLAHLYRNNVIRAGQCGGFTTEESLGL